MERCYPFTSMDYPADIPELVEMNHIGDGKTGGYIGLDKQAHFDIYNLAAGSCVPET